MSIDVFRVIFFLNVIIELNTAQLRSLWKKRSSERSRYRRHILLYHTIANHFQFIGCFSYLVSWVHTHIHTVYIIYAELCVWALRFNKQYREYKYISEQFQLSSSYFMFSIYDTQTHYTLKIRDAIIQTLSLLSVFNFHNLFRSSSENIFTIHIYVCMFFFLLFVLFLFSRAESVLLIYSIFTQLKEFCFSWK